MATIYLAVETERQEGKFVSNDALADEVVALLDGESLDVDDSVYDITSVDVVESPKAKKTPQGLQDRDLLNLDAAFKAYVVAFPIRLKDDDPDPFANLTPEQDAFIKAFSAVAFSPHVGDAVLKAKVRAAKAKARS